MAGPRGDFGVGSEIRDGIRWGFHSWPVLNFKLHFMTRVGNDDFRFLDVNCEEDWKAAIYAWGGPKPSLISRTKVEFDRPNMEFKILFLEKRFDPEYKNGKSKANQVVEEGTVKNQSTEAPDQAAGDHEETVREVEEGVSDGIFKERSGDTPSKASARSDGGHKD
jgi:hypothetical protein